jgi:predicted nicotinamide N-methyase
MKTKRLSVKVDWTELYALLIAHFRQLNKLPVGPLDRLQTREFHTLVEKVQELSSNFDLTDRELLSAYMMYEWPIRLSQGISLIQEIPELPQRVLDISTDAAPFALAALMSGCDEVVTMNTNPLALKSATDLSGRFGYPLSARENDPGLVREWQLEGKWDLIIVGYALKDLFSDIEKQKKYVLSLLGKLTENGHLLLVDSSAVDINRHFLTLRDMLVKDGVKVQAPCIWQGACPALFHGSSPCFTQRPFEKPFMINDIQKAAKLNSNSLKMTYLLLCAPGQKTTHPEGERLYRVVSPPIETFKGTRHFLCGTDGKKTLGTRLTLHPKQSKAYDYLKKGDVVGIKNPVELENELLIAEDTEFTLKAPFDKPVK